MSLETNIYNDTINETLPANVRDGLTRLARDTGISESRLQREILVAQVGDWWLDFDEMFWSNDTVWENAVGNTQWERQSETSDGLNFDGMFWSNDQNISDNQGSPETTHSQTIDTRYRQFLEQVWITEEELIVLLQRIEEQSNQAESMNTLRLESTINTISLSWDAQRLWNQHFQEQFTHILRQSRWPFELQVPEDIRWNTIIFNKESFSTQEEALRALYDMKLILQVLSSGDIPSRIAELNRGQRRLEVEAVDQDSWNGSWISIETVWTGLGFLATFILIREIRKWQNNRRAAAPARPPVQVAPAEWSEVVSERWQRVRDLITLLESDDTRLQGLQWEVQRFNGWNIEDMREGRFYNQLRIFINQAGVKLWRGKIISFWMLASNAKRKTLIDDFLKEQISNRNSLLEAFRSRSTTEAGWVYDEQMRNYIQLSHEYWNTDEFDKIEEYQNRRKIVIEEWRIWQLILWYNEADARSSVQQHFLSNIWSGKTSTEVFWRNGLGARLGEIDIERIFPIESLRSIPPEIATPEDIRARQFYHNIRNPSSSIDIQANLSEFLNSIWKNSGTNMYHWYNFKTAYAIIWHILDWHNVDRAKTLWFAEDWWALDARIGNSSANSYLVSKNRIFIVWDFQQSIINYINSLSNEGEIRDFERRIQVKFYDRVQWSRWDYNLVPKEAFQDIMINIERVLEDRINTIRGVWAIWWTTTPAEPERGSETIIRDTRIDMSNETHRARIERLFEFQTLTALWNRDTADLERIQSIINRWEFTTFWDLAIELSWTNNIEISTNQLTELRQAQRRFIGNTLLQIYRVELDRSGINYINDPDYNRMRDSWYNTIHWLRDLRTHIITRFPTSEVSSLINISWADSNRIIGRGWFWVYYENMRTHTFTVWATPRSFDAEIPNRITLAESLLSSIRRLRR